MCIGHVDIKSVAKKKKVLGQKKCLFPSDCPGRFFYHNPAAAKIVNFCELVNNAMEHLLETKVLILN